MFLCVWMNIFVEVEAHSSITKTKPTMILHNLSDSLYNKDWELTHSSPADMLEYRVKQDVVIRKTMSSSWKAGGNVLRCQLMNNRSGFWAAHLHKVQYVFCHISCFHLSESRFAERDRLQFSHRNIQIVAERVSRLNDRPHLRCQVQRLQNQHDLVHWC